MKKAFLKIFVCVIAICSALCVFTACGSLEFKINFVVDREIYATVSTSGGETIKMPNNPVKEDYTFDGWFWDKDVWEKPFTANSLLDAPLSSDMSVYAKFTKKHEHSYTAVVTAPTCTERGYTTYTCECGDSYTGDYVNELGHDFGAWIETTAPTCTTKGVETRYCSHDNTHIEAREINALGHTPETAVEENRQEPKCEVKGGYDLVVYCKTCGAELSREHKEIAALTHEFTNYVSDNNATYDSDGTKTAYCNHGCGEKYTVTDVGTKLQSGIAFKTLAVDGNNVYGKIPNTQIEFDFLTEIEKKGNLTYEVSRNLAGDDIIVSKTAEPNEGDNKYYVLVYQNKELLSRYNVTIRRREIYDVTFNTDGGTAVVPQRIEEDSLATEPTTERAGYTFTGWDYIFDNPITENTVITASWAANTDTKYKVEYYLQNLADDNYTLEFTDNLTGETDKQATAEIKTYNHYTFNASQSIVSGNVNGDGSLTLKVYYTRDIYEFTVIIDNTKGGTINCTQNGFYRYEKQINLSATLNAGYDFIGWYNGNTLISAALEYSFALSEKIYIAANYSARTDTPYQVKYYLENFDDDNYTLEMVENLTGTTDTTATAQIKDVSHYKFTTANSVLSGNIAADGSLVLKVYYKCDRFTFIAQNENVNAGTIDCTANGNHKYGTNISLSAKAKDGYEFAGWYNGETLVASELKYSFTLLSDITVIAKWQTIEYELSFDFGGGAGINPQIPEDAKLYNGHYYYCYEMSKNWTDAKAYCENLGGHLAVITSAEENSWITNNFNAIDCWLGGYRENDDWKWVTGETWGYTNWLSGEPDNYNGKEDKLNYYNTNGKWNDAPNTDIGLKRFICEWETSAVISIDKTTIYTVETETFTLPRLIKDGYVFVGWTGSNGIIPQLNVVIEKGSVGNRVYMANWQEKVEPLYKRINNSGAEDENGNYILFGEYPQTDVTASMGTILSGYVQELPTNGNNNGWTSYKYYIEGSNDTDFMWYKDISHTDGEKYRAVFFTSYRPCSVYSIPTDNYQDDCGYYINNVYWFRFETIKWEIISEENGYATLLAIQNIDCMAFDTLTDKYENSEIRTYINNDLYNNAFSVIDKTIINQVEFNSNGISVKDNVWLVSLDEARLSKNRQKQNTAYSNCLGLNNYLGKKVCGWWTRSKNNSGEYIKIDKYCWHIGYCADNYALGIDATVGVAPAIQIKL